MVLSACTVASLARSLRYEDALNRVNLKVRFDILFSFIYYFENLADYEVFTIAVYA